MQLQEQVAAFRQLLADVGLDVDDFELNVRSDDFQRLLQGGEAMLEIRCRSSEISRQYGYDGSGSWLEYVDADLRSGTFTAT